jgi:hypothetical protein
MKSDPSAQASRWQESLARHRCQPRRRKMTKVSRTTLVLSAGGLLLAFGSAARAQVPTELSGTWDPCQYDFGTHTHSTGKQWKLDQIQFKVGKEILGTDEYYFDVVGSINNSMQEMTLHIVRGSGAMPQPDIDPQIACNKGTLDLNFDTKRYTYMVGIAELAGEEGEPLTPHLVFFYPLLIGKDLKQRYFAMEVWHLGSDGAPFAEFLKDDSELKGVLDDVRKHLTREERLAFIDQGDWTVLMNKLLPQLLARSPSFLLKFFNHNGIVHGPG